MAETVGFEAVTMRAVADRLNVSTPALYYYVANRDALTDLLIDALIARVSRQRTGPWYEQLRTYLLDAQEELLRYSGIGGAFLQRQATVHVMESTQWIFDTLRAAGLSQVDATVGHRTLLSLFIGHIALCTRPIGAATSARGSATDTDTTAAFDATLRPALEQLRRLTAE